MKTSQSSGQHRAGAALSPTQPVPFWASWRAAVIVLLAFYLAMVGSLADKSTTYDEIAHLTAGYSYWTLNDYRLNPENGNFPQRVMALPLLAQDLRFGDTRSGAFRHSSEWLVGYEFFYVLENDLWWMLLTGRAAMGLLAVALGAMVYAWGRQVLGPRGGMLALVLYALNPTVLANGALMTSDLAGSLFFFASAWALWAMLHKVTLRTVLLSALAMGGLFVSKMSAVAIVPIGLILVAARLTRKEPLPVVIGKPREISSRLAQAGIFAGTIFAHVIIVVAIIWTFYGWRYEALNPALGKGEFAMAWGDLLDKPTPLGQLICDLGYLTRDLAVAVATYNKGAMSQAWTALSMIPHRAIISVIQFMRDSRLLPEAYIYGHAFVFKFSQARSAWLNGEYSLYGWRHFLPYTFLVKTPLTLFAVFALAAAGAVALMRKRLATQPRTAWWRVVADGAYRTAPLWALIVVYWLMVTSGKLSIGHRHILPTFAPLLVLAGAAAYWLSSKRRPIRLALAACLVLMLAEMAWIWPNYLAYFNQAVGGPANGYKHLVDSSLDWGQDLPALKKYLDREAKDGRQIYISYFGTGSPDVYQIPGVRLPSSPTVWDPAPAGSFLPLKGGTYAISASMLAPVMIDPPGPWCQRYEDAYQQTKADLAKLQSIQPSPADAQAYQQALTSRMQTAELLSFARLRAYLRHRQPDDNVNYSILIFRLTDEEVAQALQGPPPELGEDVIAKYQGR